MFLYVTHIDMLSAPQLRVICSLSMQKTQTTSDAMSLLAVQVELKIIKAIKCDETFGLRLKEWLPELWNLILHETLGWSTARWVWALCRFPEGGGLESHDWQNNYLTIGPLNKGHMNTVLPGHWLALPSDPKLFTFVCLLNKGAFPPHKVLYFWCFEKVPMQYMLYICCPSILKQNTIEISCHVILIFLLFFQPEHFTSLNIVFWVRNRCQGSLHNQSTKRKEFQVPPQSIEVLQLVWHF